MDNIREELVKYHKEYETDEEGLDHAEAAINDLEKGREITSVPAGEGEDLYLGQYRTIGNGITTKYIQEGGIEIIGAEINEPEDLAALMQAYRNPLFETTRVFYLQKNKVVAVEGISSRLPDLVIMEFADADMPGEHFAMAAERYGADSFYLLHNHPSGNPTPSLPDRQLTISVANATEKFAGHVVINHQRYAVIDGDGNYELMEISEKSEDLFLTPSLDHPLLGAEVDTVGKLAQVGRELEAADQSGISYLLYNSGNTIRGLQEVDSRIFLDEQFPQWLRMQMESFGCGSAVCITSNPDTYLQMDPLIRQAYLDDAIYLDPEQPLYWSKHEDNIAPDSKYVFAGVTEPDATRFYEVYDKTGRRQWSYTPQPGISRLFIDIDGTLAVFTPVEQMETLYEEGYFRNLKPHGNVIEGVKFFMKTNPATEVYILSSVLADSRYALEEKNAWADQYLPEIDRDRRIFPPCGENKADYVPGGISRADVLLDDYTDNLLNWKEQGGTGIKLMNGINGTKGRWDGRRIDGFFFPEGIASMLGTAVRRAEREAIAVLREGEANDILVETEKEEAAMDDKQINTIVVNAFGGPGVGKTTCSWEIASELKKQGLCVEYVSEYAKELVWDDNLQMLDGTVEHQKVLLDEQEKRIQRLIGKADVVVTDSPLLLNLTYCRDCPEDYKQAVLDRFNSYNNFCFLVKRDLSLDFEDRGRIHNLEESIEKDKEIQGFLKENGIYHGIYSHAQSRVLVKNISTSFNRLNQSQQKRYIEKDPEVKNASAEPTFEEKKGMFQSMSYEEQFKTVLEAEMPETRGRDGLQEDLYREYMRSDQAGFFGNQLHKQFRDKIQMSRQKVTNKDISLE